jgi:hypothetical protein
VRGAPLRERGLRDAGAAWTGLPVLLPGLVPVLVLDLVAGLPVLLGAPLWPDVGLAPALPRTLAPDVAELERPLRGAGDGSPASDWPADGSCPDPGDRLDADMGSS